MRTIELMDEAVQTAESLGYSVRHEYLGGTGGGACEFAGKKWVFIDLALNTLEQLEQIREALMEIRAVEQTSLSPTMQSFISNRAA